MKFLWVAKDFPTIPDTGALLYTNGLLNSLLDAGAQGTLLTYGVGSEVFQRFPTLKTIQVDTPRRLRVFSLLSMLQSDAWRLQSDSFLNALSSALMDRPDAIVLDYFSMGWVLPRLNAALSGMTPRPKLVYVSHNYEKAVRGDVARAAANPILRAVMLLDAWKAGRLEDQVVSAADLITTITEEDRRLYLRDAPGKQAVTLKPAFNGAIVPTAPITADTPRRVVLVGSFEWAAKQFVLRRFLEAAEGPFRKADIELLVVGKIADDFREELSTKYRSVRFTGRVKDVRPHIRGARIGVMPDDIGGGFKLKILDYVFDGLAVATIASQAAGLPLTTGVDMLTAETIPELVEEIVEVIGDVDRLDQMRRSAWRACAGQFDWKTRGQDLLTALAASSNSES